MPEWWLGAAGLGAIGSFGWSWPPLLVAVALALAMVSASLLVALAIALDAVDARNGSPTTRARAVSHLVVLILGQSIARLRGASPGG